MCVSLTALCKHSRLAKKVTYNKNAVTRLSRWAGRYMDKAKV
jgi:hypothetical protein